MRKQVLSEQRMVSSLSNTEVEATGFARKLAGCLLCGLFATLMVTTLPRCGYGEIVVAGFAEDEVRIYADGATLNDPPLRTIGGPSTGLDRPYGIAIDSIHEEIYVANDNGSTVRVFPFAGDGDITPTRSISGPNTTLSSATGIAVDSHNNEIYVANNAPGTVVVFPRTATGDVAPIRTLGGASTGLSFVRFLFLDLVSDELYVSQFSGRVSVFQRLDQGDVVPKRVIAGAATGLDKPRGVFVDIRNQEVFISDRDADSIFVFDQLANGNVAPLRTISGSNTGLNSPRGLLLTEDKELLVGSSLALWIEPSSNGDVLPLRSLNAGSIRGIASTRARFGADSFVLPLEFFVDDLESGDLSAWSSSVQ